MHEHVQKMDTASIARQVGMHHSRIVQFVRFVRFVRHYMGRLCNDSSMSDRSNIHPLFSESAARQVEQAHADTTKALKAARAKLTKLENETPRAEQTLKDQEAALADAPTDDVDAQLSARGRRDTARQLVREHEGAVAAQRAEVERLENELATIETRRELQAAWGQWETDVSIREGAIVEAIQAVREKMQTVAQMDDAIRGHVQRMRALAAELGEPEPSLGWPRGLTRPVHDRDAISAPTPITEALDAVLTFERMARRHSREQGEPERELAEAGA